MKTNLSIIYFENKYKFVLKCRGFSIIGSPTKTIDKSKDKALAVAKKFNLDIVEEDLNPKNKINYNKEIKNIFSDIKESHDIQRDNQEIPDYTCPLIDHIIEETAEVSVDLNDLSSKLLNLEETLENIRDANDTLRELGISWYLLYKNAMEQVEKLKNAGGQQ